ncbi:MAG TPA: formate/nitrite transporter family protein [Acidimicrobiales bacterium]|jgi:formate-nitrite transporter family protein|nr:formate/nitrite transporter family protein [Acidimicrobiales bacterium]
MPDQVTTAFERCIDEGERRLLRSRSALLATGTVGGLDVSIGVLALLVVHHLSGNELLAALAFGIGFIAVTLASSELFTENFLVPVTAVVAGRCRPRGLLRLWGGTACSNLAGGWVFTGLAMLGFPELRESALEIGRHYEDFGIGARSFAAGLIGGMTITLMTWMERGTDSVPGKLAAAVSAGFLLSAAKMNHAIVMSLMMFAALHAGAPFGYADWLGGATWAALANMVGGMGLVTVLRLIQVGRAQVEAERRRPPDAPRPGEDELAGLKAGNA